MAFSIRLFWEIKISYTSSSLDSNYLAGTLHSSLCNFITSLSSGIMTILSFSIRSPSITTIITTLLRSCWCFNSELESISWVEFLPCFGLHNRVTLRAQTGFLSHETEVQPKDPTAVFQPPAVFLCMIRAELNHIQNTSKHGSQGLCTKCFIPIAPCCLLRQMQLTPPLLVLVLECAQKSS